MFSSASIIALPQQFWHKITRIHHRPEMLQTMSPFDKIKLKLVGYKMATEMPTSLAADNTSDVWVDNSCSVSGKKLEG
jgi:hypothetical protein